MFLSLNSWWNEGNNEFQRVLFIIAAAATLIMIVQIILMLTGIGGDDASFDSDLDSGSDVADLSNDEGVSATAGLRILSLRSALAFLAIGGWMTYTMSYLMDWYWALLLGLAVGVAAAVGVAFLLKSVMKLQSDGNIDLEKALGKIGDVYLTVPANRNGTGKVNVTVQDSLIEREAVTDLDQPIKTGQKVKVIGVVDGSILVVEPFK